MWNWRVAAAYGLFGLAVVLAIVAIGGSLLAGIDFKTAIDLYLVTNTAIGLSAAPCGLLIARAQPRNPIGWLFLGLGIAPLLTAAAAPLMVYGTAAAWPLGLRRLIVTVFERSWPWGLFVCLPLAVQLFPTGKPLSSRWRGLMWLTLAVAVLESVSSGPTPEHGASAYLAGTGWQHYTGTLADWLSLAVLLPSVVSLVIRYHRGDETIRRQLLWLVLAVLVVVAVNMPWTLSLHSGLDILVLLSFSLIPIAATIAVLRHRMFDIVVVVSRTVLYGLLTAGVIGAYFGLVAVLDRLLRGAGAPVLATLAVALAFNPVRVRLQRLIDRALYGAGRDPVRAVTAVGQRLAGEDLAGVLEALREALRLPYAALELGSRRIAASGEPTTTLHVTPLVQQGTPIGQLVVGARWGERRLPAADRDVLDLLATPLAVALHATSLTEELQASREALITATAEERRRLHRELHDSLGPVLTGAALKADGTALAAHDDPARAERLASELADQLRLAIADVRRLVYGLRPPALDQLGLVGALRSQKGQLGAVDLTVTAPDPLPTLPAAVEVAAYRIATEAVTNVVRHAGASQAVVSLTTDFSSLQVTVTDDGTAVDAWTPGVGLQSIEQRVSEIGGRWEAGPTPAGGRVVAVLPLKGSP